MFMIDPHAEKILILDFGSQYTQLIARRIREAHVYCEIHPYFMEIEEIIAFDPKGVVLSGGHRSLANGDEEAFQLSPALFSLGIPILGICYGMQLIARHFGGDVRRATKGEYGPAHLRQINKPGRLFAGFFIEKQADVWMSHGDTVVRQPPGFRVVATSDNAPVAAMADDERAIFGVQFHPEVAHTPRGDLLIRDFVHHLCGCGGLWTPAHFVEQISVSIRDKVRNDRVLLGLSGGVDSAVTAALLHRAIGEQLICVFVDNGLLRHREGDEVMATFSEHLGVQVIAVHAEDRFFEALQGISDPEEKRIIIGEIFIEVFEETARNVIDPPVQWLAQGTIYPDVIESSGAKTGTAISIKSHHNVGGLPERMHLKLLEPLRELFKDEVRQIGLELGLPRPVLFRHPFPGPGLAVRILGEIRKSYADLLRRADAIYLEELHAAGHYEQIAQAFAVFLPVKSVGVMGDGRTYDYVIALRAVETVDFMTARAYPMPHDLLSRIAHRIINETPGINRVVYDITSKPPGTIEWE